MKFFLLVLFFGLTSHAYIPPSDMILEKTVKKHGLNAYRILLEVNLITDGEKLSFKEEWTVKNADAIRLKIWGNSESNRSFKKEFVYSDGKRYRINENGDLVYLPLRPQHFERFFHFRSLEGIKGSLVDSEILPRSTEEETKEIETENLIAEEKNAFAYEPENFVRLSRIAGTIAYAFGLPTTVSNPELPGIWIEQDQFHIRQLRLPTKEVVTAWDYQTRRGLSFPSKRKFQWKNYEVLIQTIDISRIVVGPKTKKKLDPESLREVSPSVGQPEETFNSSVMKQFYQRYR